MSNCKETGTLVSKNYLECTAEWKIPKFLERPNPRKDLSSPLFPLVTTKGTVEWQLRLYPNKYFVSQERKRECIGLYLDVYCQDKEVTFSMVSAELCLVNKEGEDVEKKYLERRHCATGRGNRFGMMNFIPWRALLGRRNDLLPHGSLVIASRIKIKIDPSAGVSDLRPLSSSVSACSFDDLASKFSWKTVDDDVQARPLGESFKVEGENAEFDAESILASDDDFASRLTSRMLESGLGADVILICNGKEYKCHKNILAAQSPMFLKMFASKIEPIKLDMSDQMTQLSVEDLLSYLYTGQIRHPTQNNLLLYTAAIEYEIPELRELVETDIQSCLTTETAIDLLLFAQKSGANALRKMAAEFIANA